MIDQQLHDRLEALETLTTQLVRTLHRTGVLSDTDRDQVLDSLEEICTGEPGVSFAAETLAEGISPRKPSATAEEGAADHMADIRYRRKLYGEEKDGG